MNKISILVIFASTLASSIIYSDLNNYFENESTIDDISISATVIETCDISVPDLNLDAYNLNSKNINITYHCTKGISSQVTIITPTLKTSKHIKSDKVLKVHTSYNLLTTTGQPQTVIYTKNLTVNQFDKHTQSLNVTLDF